MPLRIASYILIATIVTASCKAPPLEIQYKHDASYYAGAFRACEIVMKRVGVAGYIEVDGDMTMQPADYCRHLVMSLMDADAHTLYSRNWPGYCHVMKYCGEKNVSVRKYH